VAWTTEMQSATPSVVDLAQVKPPRGLGDFKVHFAMTPTEPDGAEFVAFELSCPTCLGDAFHLLELSASLGPAGIRARCAACDHEGQVFDATTDGYDGVYGHLDFLKTAQTAKPLEGKSDVLLGAVQVRAGFSYSIPMSELMEHAEEARVEPQDLFDWFYILTKTADVEAWEWTWDFECA